MKRARLLVTGLRVIIRVVAGFGLASETRASSSSRVRRGVSSSMTVMVPGRALKLAALAETVTRAGALGTPLFTTERKKNSERVPAGMVRVAGTVILEGSELVKLTVKSTFVSVFRVTEPTTELGPAPSLILFVAISTMSVGTSLSITVNAAAALA